MSNKSKGSKFEEDFAEYMSNRGYWVHLFAGASHTGSQPCDVIAVRRDCAEFYDCKTLEKKNGLFPISRIEENQILAYEKIRATRNPKTIFSLIIIWNNDLYCVDFDDIDFNSKSINLKLEKPFLIDFYNDKGEINENYCR